MPLIKSAIKRARQNEIRRQRLLPYKTYMKTMIKKMTDLVKEGKIDEATKLLPETYSAIATAEKKNIIHRKTADRRKAKMAKLVAAK